MSRATDIRINEVQCELESHRYRTPLKFGGVPTDHCELLNVTIRVERPDGTRAEGFGSMPLGNVWSFPPRYVPVDQSLAAMKRLADEIADVVRGCRATGHPIDLVTQLQPEFLQRAARVSEALGLATPIPKLCSLVVISPFDAAIHDAFGKANGINSYDGLGAAYVERDLSAYLDERFRGRNLDAYTSREPTPSMPLYHLIGAMDPLTDAEVEHRLDDGLPETLGEWIEADGLTHLKIKMNGDDLDWDVQRVLNVDAVTAETQRARGVHEWYYSVDFNECCEDVAYLLAFFARVAEANRPAFERIQYVEQPTDRDLAAHPHNRMHDAARIRPVVIDESLTDYASLLLAREQGYSGAALKACKGQTEALLMAAAGQELGMFLTVQDLTCPGASFLQSAGLAARVPTVAAVEGNARQFCPAANRAWAKRYPGLFEITDGRVATRSLTRPGLGH